MPSGNERLGEFCKATSDALTKAFASGAISPVEVAKAAVQRAEEINPTLGAFTVINHDGALDAARQSEARWHRGEPLSPIDGVPTTIKDIVHAHGFDVRYGSLTTGDVSDQPDAPSVARLRRAGAVFLGLTNTPEFGWKAVTDNRKFGTTKNPWNAARTPGGSSGGAAAAAASGAGVLHLGTDGGGSIRIPASFSGIVGHKPSFGFVPAYPASAFGTVAHIGPMARTVEDVVRMLNAMSGKDIRDWSQPPYQATPIDPKPMNWNGIRIGFWRDPCVGLNDAEVAAAVQSAITDLQLAGAHVDVIKLPMQDDLLEIFYRHWYVGAANRLTTVRQEDHSKLDPGFLEAARHGQRYSAVERMQAEVARSQYGAKMDQLLEDFDLLVSPTVPIPAFEIDADFPADVGFESWVEWSSYSYPINLSQQPACSVPCGLTSNGLPIGLQIIGGRARDQAVLSAALTYQQMYPERFLLPDGHWPEWSERAA